MDRPGLKNLFSLNKHNPINTTSTPVKETEPHTESMGKGIICALLLLSIAEALLHSDGFLYKYRSVFATGRAMDKILFVEKTTPQLIMIGNSRVDNGFDPKTLVKTLGDHSPDSAFNLGIPGANARVFFGIFKRFEQKRLLDTGKILTVLIGLDENFLRQEDNLGYSTFLADRPSMLSNAEYLDLLKSCFRLWGYAGNLKNLREPEKLLRFFKASFSHMDPLGGGAALHLGYRANSPNKFQSTEQLKRQEAESLSPPKPEVVHYFWRLIDLLQNNNIRCAVFFPPLFNRNTLYISPGNSQAPPYLFIAKELANRGIPLIQLTQNQEKQFREFSNAGHLNDIGAQRYTTLLAQKLIKIDFKKQSRNLSLR